ncbi:hypothetical protein H4R19_004081, partial [Coemansia spiralis]
LADVMVPAGLDDSALPADQGSKRRVPLRKRSLIYAIYCTAQPSAADAGAVPSARSPAAPPARVGQAEDAGFMWHGLQKYQIEPPASYPLAAINASSIYASCQSIPSASASQASTCSASPASSVVAVSPGTYSYNQQMSDMSVRFMVVDVVNHLTALQRQARGGRSSNGSSHTSVASSRSSYAEPQTIGETAYRCSSRCAPRLSTIERADDGRVLLRPSASVSTAHTQDDYGAADSDESAAGGMGAAGGHLLAPRMASVNGAAHGAVDSMRIHASKLGTEAHVVSGHSFFDYGTSLASLDGSAAAAADPDAADSLAPPPDDALPFSIMTPPESPDKSSQTTANTSLVTAVAAGDYLDASQPGAADAGMAGTANVAAAELPSKLTSCYYAPGSIRADSHGRAGCPAEPRDSVMASCEAGRCGAECGFTGCSPVTSTLPRRASDTEPAADKRQLPPGEQHQMPATGTEASLLFRGHYANIARSAAPDCQLPIPPHSDAVPAADCGGADAGIADRLAASAAPASPTPAPSGPANQRRTQEASKSRKLTAALVKAAQLDGLRQLQRMIRSGGGRRAPGTQHDGSSTVSSGGSSSAYGTQRSGAAEPRQKVFRFNELVAVYETWDRGEYDRRGMPASKLDAELIEKIKNELNDFKAHEMRVHDESRANTHFIF